MGKSPSANATFTFPLQNTPKISVHYPERVQLLTGPEREERAGELLAEGSLVIIPTETVYGLGADAENAEAVARIFATKNRPTDHPLIVHMSSADSLDYWGVNIPDYARDLAAAYWPGPMTLVITRSDKAKNFITGNQDTVALRVPGHETARHIIDALATAKTNPHAGVAAPSANRFGKVSPTTVEHAVNELSDHLSETDAAIDGGPCDVGIESTIIDCTGTQPAILRSGAITMSDINAITALSKLGSDVRAPGMLASHYAPQATVCIIDSIDQAIGDSVAFIAPAQFPTPQNCLRLAAPIDATEYARVLYAALRQGDERGFTSIFVIPPQGSGIAAAVRDRLARAAHK